MSDPNRAPMRPPSPLLRPIYLSWCGDHWAAVPTAIECRAGRAFRPFRLPPVPRSMVDWLVVGGQRLWQRHRRSMAALLLIDCASGVWTLHLPTQHCGPQAPRWSTTTPENLDLASSVRIGGSFQVLAGDDAPRDAVPATAAGFHFTLSVTAERPLAAFVRHGNDEVTAVELSTVVADDWGAAIEAALPRLRLA